MTTQATAGLPPVSDQQTQVDYAVLRVSLLLVLVYCGFGLLGFAVMAGFWPPPGEDLGARAISAYFAEHHLAITIGMIMMAAAGPFYFPWSAAISKIISRIEGPMGVLSTIELLGGLLTAIVTFVPATIWITASFRGAERSPELVHMLYDFGWMFFDITFFCSTLQCFALGVAILVDRRMVPLLPRWTAYVAFLTGLSYVPLLLMPLVTTGPFSWSGAVSFWVVFVMFFVMIAVVTPYAYRALRRLEREDLASLPAA